MAINTSVSAQVAVPVSAVPKNKFPFLDLKAQFARIRGEVISAVEKVLDEQHFILGPEVEAFEAEMARFVETKFAIGCASGSDALLLALMALNVGTGDEVITTPFTFGATVGAIARLQARPVFVDIDPATFNIDPSQLADAVTPRTRAIIPVHLFGLPADMKPISAIARERNIAIIEDAAQAIGSTYGGKPVGGLGTMACFSFFPSKNLGCAGDGGMVTTDDAELAEKVKILRLHGCQRKYQYELVGMNSRLDALQAAILRVKIRHLKVWTAERKRNAERYRKLFGEFGLGPMVQLPMEPPNRSHVYNQFVIRTSHRDELREHLRLAGIPTEIYYPSPMHVERAYAYLGHQHEDFPQAEAASREVLSLPIFSEITEEQQRFVVEAIADFYKNIQH